MSVARAIGVLIAHRVKVGMELAVVDGRDHMVVRVKRVEAVEVNRNQTRVHLQTDDGWFYSCDANETLMVVL